MFFQFDVQTLTVLGILGEANASLQGMLPLTDGHSAAPWSALLQMMYRMGESTSSLRRRWTRMMMMMVMIGGQGIFVTLFLHGKVIIVAARLQ